VRPSNQHLSPDEIDIAVGQPQHFPRSAAAAHVGHCEECRRTLEAQRAAQERLDTIRRTTTAPERAACPETQRWVALALGKAGADAVRDLMSHASQCDACGQILAELMVGDESDAVPAWTPEITRGVARKMALGCEARPSGIAIPIETFHIRRRVKPAWMVWGAAAAVVIMSIAAVGWAQGWFRQHPPFGLLAEAYTAQRPTDLRFPGADYAPVSTQRGPAGRSRMESLPALLESKLRIEHGLEKHRDDPEWLQAKARAELLLWDFDEARKTLQQALDRAPDSVSLQQDLAMTWFEAAEAHGGDAADYAQAIELFSRVLLAHPNDPVALFNRALANERMFLIKQAEQDWQQYLRLDSSSGWAGEAREHLGKLEKKLGLLERPVNPNKLEPGDPAVMELFHAAYGQQADPRDAAPARSKLGQLATKFESQYQDRWVADVIREKDRVRFGSGVERVYEAFRQNQSGDPIVGVREARLAVSQFHQIGAEAGELRARFELAYGLHLSLQGRGCLQESRSLLKALLGKPYPWLRAQAYLESSCGRSMLGAFDDAGADAGAGEAEAGSHGLLTLRLRGLAFEAAALNEIGRWRSAWDLERAGLELFWGSNCAPYRAYQFYDDLSISAERRDNFELALLLTQEAVFIIAKAGDQQTEAMERQKLARLALSAGDASEARRELHKSDELFASLPASPVMDLYRSYGLIWLARAEDQQGNAREAVNQLLLPTEKLVLAVDNDAVRASFYQVLAEAYQQLGERELAGHALSMVLNYGEKALRSLRTDRDRLSWAKEMDDAYRSMVRVTLEDSRPERAFAFWEWYKASDLRTDRPAADPGASVSVLPAQIREIGKSLRQATVVSYAQMEDGIAAWNLDGSGVQYRWLPIPRRDMIKLARRFATACANPRAPLEEIEALGSEVYRQLVAPMAPRWIKGGTVLLEIDGPAAMIPFEAIQTPDGRFLGDVYKFVTSPGILYSQIGPSAMPPPAKQGKHVLAVGNPRVGTQWIHQYPPLPDALTEAETAAALLPDGIVLTGTGASQLAVRRALSTATVFHFAGHAISTPERSGLLLAADEPEESAYGFWTAGDLGPDALQHCALVVLSACSTGEMDESGLIDPDNLVRRFLIARAREVVASRWPVDSRVTRDLMAAFYVELKHGRTPAAALSLASHNLRARSGMNHPSFWAAFSVFGATDTGLAIFQ